MTNEELDKFQGNFLYEWNVRKMSIGAWLKESEVQDQAPEAQMEVLEPQQPLVAKQPMMPPPAHLLVVKTPQYDGNYYTRMDSR